MLASGSVVGIAARFLTSSNSLSKFLSKVIITLVSVWTGKLQRPKSVIRPGGILYSFFKNV